MNKNRAAFLDLTAFSEGTSTHPLTKDRGYDVIVTGVDGPEIFTSYAAHPFAPEYPGNGGFKRPSKIINRKGLTSNAAGRYQHMLVHWNHYRKQLGLPDFSPGSQDLWAIQLIRERHALPLIDGGNIIEAIKACSNLWASFPGAGYGQHENHMDSLIEAYLAAGGEMA